MSTKNLKHIVGSTFSLLLKCTDSPLVAAGVPVADTSTWGVALELKTTADRPKITISGSWVSSVTPFAMKFEHVDTTAWLPGTYDIRLLYTSPDSRPFMVDTDSVLELIA